MSIGCLMLMIIEEIEKFFLSSEVVRKPSNDRNDYRDDLIMNIPYKANVSSRPQIEGSLPIKVIADHAALTRLTNGKNLSSRMIHWVLKISKFNIEWEHAGTQNAVADVLSNSYESIVGKRKLIVCNNQGFGTFVTREQLIEEQQIAQN
ncbi:hypothetical protein TNCV_198611 [Trichonephila clavipes]|nr:hypothetical protein TNCV_198611 [Trichonephila clavipes]